MAYATGDRRMMALHTVQPKTLTLDKPLVVAVGRNIDDIYDNWRKQVWAQGSLFGLLVFSMIGLAVHQRGRGRTGIAVARERGAFPRSRECRPRADLDGGSR